MKITKHGPTLSNKPIQQEKNPEITEIRWRRLKFVETPWIVS